ncbi:DUF6042 family protein [Streptomyces bobili]|uniref:DUF6042 family protein n=1 Tax=Streptomyces bobili TaxID=67280 RepID=UPI0037237895
MKTVPLTDWSRDHRDQHFDSVAGGGWLRVPPPMFGLLLMALTRQAKPLTRDDLRPFINPSGDWQASCWDEGAAERDAEELADLQAAQATATAYAAHYGLPPLHTLNDMLNLMIAAGLVHEIPGEDGQNRLHPAYPLPGPHQVFPLDEEESAVQESLRRHHAYGGDSYRIIGLFDPLGARHQDITTSLDRLARVIEGHPHDAREALRLLLDEQDFTTTADIAAIPSHKVFRLRCDWDRFDAHRTQVRRGREGRIKVTVPADWEDSA